MNNKSLPTICVDTREKYSWTFTAAVNAGKVSGISIETLKEGDYCLKENPELVIIERKRNVNELYLNFVNHMDRIEAEMIRLQKYKFRYIIVEQTWDALYDISNFKYLKKAATKKWAGSMIMGRLIYLMNTYNVHVIFAGAYAENTACSILLKHYDDWLKSKK